jgi:hypothetical protein
MQRQRTTFLALFPVWCLVAFTRSVLGATDFSAPEPQSIRKDYETAKQQRDQALTNRLSHLVEQHLAEARQQYDEQKRLRNITGIAVARKAVSIFEDCLQQLEQKGSFQIPDSVRRELADSIAKFRQGKQAIESEHEAALAELKSASAQRLAAVAAPVGEAPGTDTAETLFEKLLAYVPPPKVEAPATAAADGEAAPGAPAGTPPLPAPVQPAVPEIVASSGEADAWQSFARWRATASGLEVVRVPIAGRGEDETKSGFSPMTETQFETRYEAIEAIDPNEQAVFRVKSVPGQNPVEVLQWPSARNGWTIEFRIRPGATLPSEYSVELQVNPAGLRGAAPPAASAPAREAAPVATNRPSHSNRPNELRTVVVTPRAGWRLSGVSVKKGDLLRMSVTGTWSCGARGEQTDARGYPPDERYRHYYLGGQIAKRQIANAQYGALLMRFGPTGPMGAIGTEASITAPQDAMLFFDVNEALDPPWREDNRGSLTVSIARHAAVAPDPGSAGQR